MSDKHVADSDDLQYILREAGWRMLKALNSGKTTRQPADVGVWLSHSVDCRFADAHSVLSWAIQNNVQYYRSQPGVVSELFNGMVDCVQLCWAFGRVLFGVKPYSIPFVELAIPANLLLFRAGRRAKALNSLDNWLKNAVTKYPVADQIE